VPNWEKKSVIIAYLRRHVAHEIFLAIAYFKDLVPTMEEYIYNDGTSKNLMSLKGTIPVMITGKGHTTYNIPISLWIEDNYPQTAPICYVRPTREMMVLRGKFVSSNGEILLPYLEDWSNVRSPPQKVTSRTSQSQRG
uniref:Zgc:123278 n=1 Tax=Salarias fasciatus TaxID=181472 RepID=A0A672FYF4_SALFA